MPIWIWFVFCKILKFFAKLEKKQQPLVARSFKRLPYSSFVALFFGFKPD